MRDEMEKNEEILKFQQFRQFFLCVVCKMWWWGVKWWPLWLWFKKTFQVVWLYNLTTWFRFNSHTFYLQNLSLFYLLFCHCQLSQNIKVYCNFVLNKTTNNNSNNNTTRVAKVSKVWRIIIHYRKLIIICVVICDLMPTVISWTFTTLLYATEKKNEMKFLRSTRRLVLVYSPHLKLDCEFFLSLCCVFFLNIFLYISHYRQYVQSIQSTR